MRNILLGQYLLAPMHMRSNVYQIAYDRSNTRIRQGNGPIPLFWGGGTLGLVRVS